jgi:multiple sugar transport system ATP-binding protein
MGRAMVRTPDVFLFDEPLSNLDAKLRGHMRLELRKLHQQLKTTTLYVTHDQIEAMTLADRIVIMRDGKIEQIGTPRDIYRRPDTVFVATFIGSPPMNLIEMTVEGDGLVADGIRFGLDGKCPTALGAGQKVLVGVRPTDIAIAGSKANATGVVQVVELLGASAILSVKVGASDLIAEIDGSTTVEAGQPVEIAVDPASLHLFDTKTERRLN